MFVIVRTPRGVVGEGGEMLTITPPKLHRAYGGGADVTDVAWYEAVSVNGPAPTVMSAAMDGRRYVPSPVKMRPWGEVGMLPPPRRSHAPVAEPVSATGAADDVFMRVRSNTCVAAATCWIERERIRIPNSYPVIGQPTHRASPSLVEPHADADADADGDRGRQHDAAEQRDATGGCETLRLDSLALGRRWFWHHQLVHASHVVAVEGGAGARNRRGRRDCGCRAVAVLHVELREHDARPRHLSTLRPDGVDTKRAGERALQARGFQPQAGLVPAPRPRPGGARATPKRRARAGCGGAAKGLPHAVRRRALHAAAHS